MRHREFENKRNQFNEIAWHDSEILSFELIEKGDTFELSFNLNLFEKNKKFGYDKNFRVLKFINCRIIQIDLDLLGMKLCGGTISSAYCNVNSPAVESKTRNKIKDFDLPQDKLPLEDCLVFEIEMIQPTGIIVVFAKNFEVN